MVTATRHCAPAPRESLSAPLPPLAGGLAAALGPTAKLSSNADTMLLLLPLPSLPSLPLSAVAVAVAVAAALLLAGGNCRKSSGA
jgi:hypothetical protein